MIQFQFEGITVINGILAKILELTNLVCLVQTPCFLHSNVWNVFTLGRTYGAGSIKMKAEAKVVNLQVEAGDLIELHLISRLNKSYLLLIFNIYWISPVENGCIGRLTAWHYALLKSYSPKLHLQSQVFPIKRVGKSSWNGVCDCCSITFKEVGLGILTRKHGLNTVRLLGKPN